VAVHWTWVGSPPERVAEYWRWPAVSVCVALAWTEMDSEKWKPEAATPPPHPAMRRMAGAVRRASGLGNLWAIPYAST
jgi:hypothetical protein